MESSCPTFPPRTAAHTSGSCRYNLSTALSSMPVFALSHHFVRISLCCWAVFSARVGSFSWWGRWWACHVCTGAIVHSPGPYISTELTGHGLCELQHGYHTVPRMHNVGSGPGPQWCLTSCIYLSFLHDWNCLEGLLSVFTESKYPLPSSSPLKFRAQNIIFATSRLVAILWPYIFYHINLNFFKSGALKSFIFYFRRKEREKGPWWEICC